MDKPSRNHFQTLIKLHNRGVLHPCFLINGVADLLTEDDFDEVMDQLPVSAKFQIAEWVKMIPRDPTVEVIEPIPDGIVARLFTWLDAFESKGE